MHGVATQEVLVKNVIVPPRHSNWCRCEVVPPAAGSWTVDRGENRSLGKFASYLPRNCSDSNENMKEFPI